MGWWCWCWCRWQWRWWRWWRLFVQVYVNNSAVRQLEANTFRGLKISNLQISHAQVVRIMMVWRWWWFNMMMMTTLLIMMIMAVLVVMILWWQTKQNFAAFKNWPWGLPRARRHTSGILISFSLSGRKVLKTNERGDSNSNIDANDLLGDCCPYLWHSSFRTSNASGSEMAALEMKN